MRTGPINSETAERRIDREGDLLALWEQGTSAPFELPWPSASSLTTDEVRLLLSGARYAVLAVGTGPSSRSLFDATLATLPGGTRLHVYGDVTLEGDAQAVAKVLDPKVRVLARLGVCVPADWLVVDGGRVGVLLLGPDRTSRRWAIRVDGSIARSLFEAFRALFWFRSTREALPDASRVRAWRTPIAAPFAPLADHVALPAGELRLNSELPDAAPDAEYRVVPTLADPGRAATIVMPPTPAVAGTGQQVEVAIDLPRRLVQRGSRVLWVDTGLPRTTVTRERLTIDLVESPVSLRLEWSRALAIDLIHRLERATRQPAWAFHASRRLGDVQGAVLVAGASKPQSVTPLEEIALADVVAPLSDFENAQPPKFPDPSMLARSVVYRWRRKPQSEPQGSRPATLVQSWKTVDEWGSRLVDQCREAQVRLRQHDDGLLARLRRWLPAHDAVSAEIGRLGDELDEIGERSPSADVRSAAARLGRLREIHDRLRGLDEQTNTNLQRAEDQAAEDEQRREWSARVDGAKATLERLPARVSVAEADHVQLRKAQGEAEATLRAALKDHRDSRLGALRTERGEIESQLAGLRASLKALDKEHAGNPPKEDRKNLTSQIQLCERQLGQFRKDESQIAVWMPDAAAVIEMQQGVNDGKKAFGEAEGLVRRLKGELSAAEAAAREEFRLVAPPRRSASPMAPAPKMPPVPDEALPELGDLREHLGRRYLAVRTWEQVQRALPASARLKADLVVAHQSGTP